MSNNAIVTILSKQQFQDLLLNHNPGVIIIKFGADWCGPCKRIEHQVNVSMNQMPDNVKNIILNIDESFELYGFLRTKKMVTSIPTLLAYYKNNTSYVPDDCIVGADTVEIDSFFRRIYEYSCD